MRIKTRDEPTVIRDLEQCPECGTRARNCHVIIFHDVPVNTFLKILKDTVRERGWGDCLIQNISGGYRLIGPLACKCEQEEAAGPDAADNKES